MRQSGFFQIINNKMFWVAVVMWTTVTFAPFAKSNNGPYELSWYTIDGGGSRSSGGPYVLTGTIGQTEAA
ncbi:MAG: hypothetical protein ACYS67_09440 [Planctomycetota bacterium]|jgi:hypothetical protein